MRRLVWLCGLLVWTYLLVVPVDWLPEFLRFGGGDKPVFISWGKVGHAMAYATLAALVPLIASRPSGRRLLWIVLCSHAFATEFIQTFVPTRTGAWFDVAIDLSGITVGWLLARLWPVQWIAPAIQAQQHAGGENQNADLLRNR